MSLPEKSIRRRTGAGSIYAIGAVGSPYVKIGSTQTSVEQRLRTLQTGQPATLHIVATQTVETDLHRIERQIHKFLDAERHHGEWFACMLNVEELQKLILRAVEYLAEADRATQLEAKQHTKKRGRGLRIADDTLGDTIRQYRRSLGLTQEELARRIGCKRVSIAHYEGWAVTPPLPILKALANTFQISLDTLVNGEQAPPQEPLPQLKALDRPIAHTSPRSADPSQLTWEW